MIRNKSLPDAFSLRQRLGRSTRYIWLVILLAIMDMSCNSIDQTTRYTIGFSQCTMVNLWRQTMLESMKRELAFHPEIRLIFKDANGNS
ncbi:MAG: hypothetical protein KGM98_05120, partial [Bacteroidota bacterium]|nr:hypothetical protein [Bacteroidota bacterium]